MKVYNEGRNFVFDEADPRCIVRFCPVRGGVFAFIQCLDLDCSERSPIVPEIKRYWGYWDPDAPEASLKEIMEWGGKWPELPPIELYEGHAELEYKE